MDNKSTRNALFETDNISSVELLLGHNILSLTLPNITLFYVSVSKGAASNIFTPGMVRPGFRPTTSRSKADALTN